MKKDGIFNEAKPAVTPSLALNLELVQKKETNIGTNYGPNIDNNGTLSLPDGLVKKTLPESEDEKQ